MKIIGVVALLLLAYFVWRFVVAGDPLVLVTPDTGDRVTAVVKRVVPGKALVIEIRNKNKDNRITQISMLRSVAQSLGVSEPSGFKVEGLPLTEDDRKSEETVDFVKQYNIEHLRWVGNLELVPNARTELAIPVTAMPPLNGIIDFQYEAKVGFGGSISFFRLDLAEQETSAMLQPTGKADGPAGG